MHVGRERLPGPDNCVKVWHVVLFMCFEPKRELSGVGRRGRGHTPHARRARLPAVFIAALSVAHFARCRELPSWQRAIDTPIRCLGSKQRVIASGCLYGLCHCCGESLASVRRLVFSSRCVQRSSLCSWWECFSK